MFFEISKFRVMNVMPRDEFEMTPTGKSPKMDRCTANLRPRIRDSARIVEDRR